MNSDVLLGLMIPFAGTALGSGCVFFMKKEMGALKVAEDAIVLDNTSISIEDTFLMVKKIIEEKVRNKEGSNKEW